VHDETALAIDADDALWRESGSIALVESVSKPSVSCLLPNGASCFAARSKRWRELLAYPNVL
jgi:hypothetical protein